MGMHGLQELTSVKDLISLAYQETDPVILSDADDECLVVMTPAVFERILFEGEQLNTTMRSSLHL